MFYTYIIFFSIYFLVYFWLLWVFIVARSLSLVAESGVFFIAVRGLLIVMPSLIAEHELQRLRFQ